MRTLDKNGFSTAASYAMEIDLDIGFIFIGLVFSRTQVPCWNIRVSDTVNIERENNIQDKKKMWEARQKCVG